MATKDGRTQIWYADGNGNVEGYTETVGDIAETIIGTYNEHFGTVIQIWTPETISLQVGDTVPNWDAYEKITINMVRLKINQPNTPVYSFGILENNIFTMVCLSSNQLCVALQDGQIVDGGGGDPYEYMNSYWKPRLEAQGYNVTSYQISVGEYQIGEYVEDWDEYTLLQ